MAEAVAEDGKYFVDQSGRKKPYRQRWKVLDGYPRFSTIESPVPIELRNVPKC